MGIQHLRDRGLIGHEEYWDRYLSISEAASNEEIAAQAKIYQASQDLLVKAKSPEQRQTLEAEAEAALSQIDRLIAQRKQKHLQVDQGQFNDIEKPKLDFDRQHANAIAQNQDEATKQRQALARDTMTESDRVRTALVQDADLQLQARTRQINSEVELRKISQEEGARQIDLERQLRDEIVKTGLATQSQADAAKASPVTGVERAFSRYKTTAMDVAGGVEQAFSRAFQGMEDAMVSFVMTGKGDFKSLASSIISDLIRIQIRASMSQMMGGAGGPLGALLSMFGGGGGGGGGTISSAGGGGSYALPGGRLNAMALGGVVSDAPSLSAYRNTVQTSPQFFTFGKLHAYAKGGVFAEAGPEAIMPLRRDSQGRLGVAAMGGSSGAVSVEVHNYGNQQATARETTDSRGNRRVEVIIGDMVAGEQSRPGSSMYNAQRTTFGLQPTLTRR